MYTALGRLTEEQKQKNYEELMELHNNFNWRFHHYSSLNEDDFRKNEIEVNASATNESLKNSTRRMQEKEQDPEFTKFSEQMKKTE